MEHTLIEWNKEVSGCSDSELVAGCRKLSATDCRVGTRLVVYIAEVDARGLFAELAYSSIFHFLTQELHMSEGQAALRMNAARLVRKFPVIVSKLASGAVHLTALRQISRFLTDENHLQLLERVRGKSKREVEKLVVELDPQPDMPSADAEASPGCSAGRRSERDGCCGARSAERAGGSAAVGGD
jgi:hypothetical protein